ncbi:MAG TPA: IS1182 family transposase [Caulobacteraceae bacterium]|nr:IS1182 family transposase [Caulobacteraceae bacterium]
MSNFRPVDRQSLFLLPPSVDEWLPQRHLARFVVEVIEQLDLRALVGAYRGSGSASYHPSVLLGLLVYGYATRVFSSRRIEQATHDSVAFRFIAANDHPDHDTIATFRSRFLKEIEGLFVQALLLARESGLLKLGTVALDGTKIHANASRHNALSYEHAGKIEAQLKGEVAELLALAAAADQAEVPDGMSIPQELARREDRVARLAEAKAKIAARATARRAREQAEYEAKIKAREERAQTTGKKPGGRPPQPPAAGPGSTDQVNLTDEDWRIMPVAGGGFEQCYNAQATVAGGSLLVVANDVVQATNDKEQIAPMLARLTRLPQALGKPETLLADSGYFSAANVTACAAAGIAPLIALGRERHHRSWKDRFAAAPPAPPDPTPVQAMVHRLASPEGRQTYALRKQTPEPVFGIIKTVMGFRQFLLRGLDKAKGEWNLVTLAWNVKRMFALAAA